MTKGGTLLHSWFHWRFQGETSQVWKKWHRNPVELEGGRGYSFLWHTGIYRCTGYNFGPLCLKQGKGKGKGFQWVYKRQYNIPTHCIPIVPTLGTRLLEETTAARTIGMLNNDSMRRQLPPGEVGGAILWSHFHWTPLNWPRGGQKPSNSKQGPQGLRYHANTTELLNPHSSLSHPWPPLPIHVPLLLVMSPVLMVKDNFVC